MFIGFNILNQKNRYIKQLINKTLESFNTSLGKKAYDILIEINYDEEIRTLLYERKLEEK